jgi:dTDP-4-amino-4,6-dideoxygalactose transaminase
MHLPQRTISFYATKNITTGEGGIITTNDDAFADRLRVFRNQGMRERYQSYLNQRLNSARDCPLVSSNLATKLEQLNPAWIGRLWRVEANGTVHPPRKGA